MVCKNCGKENDDNLDYCGECGAPLNEPEVIKVTKEDLKKLKKNPPRLTAEGAFFDVTGFAESLKTDLAKLIALIAAILVYLAPFMSWMVKENKDDTIKASLFDIAGKNADLALHQTSMIIAAFVLLLVALAMIMFSIRENVRPLRPFADKFVLWLLPGLIGIVMYVLVVKNTAYTDAIDNDFINNGIGNKFCIAGLVIYIVAVIMEKINRNE